MTLAVVALFAEGPTAIRNVYNWRVKETERMKAIVTELTKLGAEVRHCMHALYLCLCVHIAAFKVTVLSSNTTYHSTQSVAVCATAASMQHEVLPAHRRT
jgi:EPSP synthase (3-phosphoshikimate 1-carboxyvinyltransferase)